MSGGLSPPQIVNSFREGSIIVRHREYICDVDGTVAFAKQTFDINPGIVRSFPWLAQIANAFEQYRWRGIIYEYKSTCSDAVVSGATTPSIGTVMLATDYNSPDGNQFTSKLIMENHEFSNSGKPSTNMIHPVECSSRLTPMTRLWVRDGGIGANQDLRLYDLGAFTIATVGFPGANASVGELWVTYEIEFYKTKFSHPDAEECSFDRFLLTTGITNTAPFGTAATRTSTSVLEGSVNSTGTTYTLPNGGMNGEKYYWTYHVTAQTNSGDIDEYTDVTVTLGAGLQGVTAFSAGNGGAANSVSHQFSHAALAQTLLYTDWCLMGMFEIVDSTADQTLAFTVGVALPTGTGLKGEFMVIRIPQSFSVS